MSEEKRVKIMLLLLTNATFLRKALSVDINVPIYDDIINMLKKHSKNCNNIHCLYKLTEKIALKLNDIH